MTARIKGIILIFAIILTTIAVCISATAKSNNIKNTIPEKDETKYFLGEFKGNLAIYQTNNQVPLEVLDVYIESLPERDIERIKSGVFADTLNEIMMIAEDYE